MSVLPAVCGLAVLLLVPGGGTFLLHPLASTSTVRSELAPSLHHPAVGILIPGPRGVPSAVPLGAPVGTPPLLTDARLILSPSSGSSGTSVTASGKGLAAFSSVSFAGAGQPSVAPSKCRVDAHGRFPGVTGTPCTFTLPALPGGNQTIHAFESGWATPGTGIAVGSGPWGAAYDYGTHEIYVPAFNKNQVDVLADGNHSLLRTIDVGNGPTSVAFDPNTDQLFVVNYGSGNVSVISDASHRVVAWVRVGNDPDAIAVDPVNHAVFVANYYNGTVSVISDSTDSVVATVGVGSAPSDLAYDPVLGEMFVANLGSANVSVVRDSTDTVAASIPAGRWPYGLAYDAVHQEMFVVNEQSCNVSVVADANDSVVATVPLPGASYPIGVAVDSAVDEVFVADYGGTNVSVISPVTNQVVDTLAVGDQPIAITYDNGSGEVYVSNWGSNNLSYVPTSNATAIASFSVTTVMSLGNPSGSADYGQNLTFEGTGFGSSDPIVRFSLGSTAVSCNNASVGSCVSGALTTAVNGSFVARVQVPDLGTPGTFVGEANDSSGFSAEVLVRLYADPVAGAVAATPPSVDLGQAAQFNVSVQYGTGSYTYRWSGLPPGCAGTSSPLDCSPSAAGNFTVRVNVTDSNGFAISSTSAVFTVHPDPVVSAPKLTPSRGVVDAGQNVSFSVVTTAGTGVYLYWTWFGLPPSCRSTSATVRCSGAEVTTGTYRVSAQVTDSNNFTSQPSPAVSLGVDPDPTVSTPESTPAVIDLGQAVTFSTVALYGSGTYTFTWAGLPAGCPAANRSSVTCRPSQAGLSTVEVSVRDTNNGSAASGSLAFSVDPQPTVALSEDRAAIDPGTPVSIAASPAGGESPYTFSWYGLPSGCSGRSATVSCAPRVPGSYGLQVRVTDSLGVGSMSSVLPLLIAQPFSALIAAQSTTPTPGERIALAAQTQGGTDPVVFAWAFGDGSAATGANVTHAFPAAGAYTVVLWANDSGGSNLVVTLSIAVSVASSPSNASTAGGPGYGWDLLGGVAVVAMVLIVAAVVTSRRRRGAGPQLDEEPPLENDLYGMGTVPYADGAVDSPETPAPAADE